MDDRKINPGIAIYLLPHVSSGDRGLFLPAPTNGKRCELIAIEALRLLWSS